MDKKKIVVVGGGFGGVYAALTLSRKLSFRDADITLLHDHEHFVFAPFLHEVATGSVTVSEATEPIQNIFTGRNVRLVKGEAETIDSAARVVKTSAGNFSYDYLILATGARSRLSVQWDTTNRALHLKTLEDARLIRKRLRAQFEEAVAASHKDGKKQALSFVVVGAGPTGTELAAEVAEYACRSLLHHFSNAGIMKEDISVTLIGDSVDVVPQFHPAIRGYAVDELKKRRVKIELGFRVRETGKDALWLENGKKIPAALIIATSGVEPAVSALFGLFPRDKSERIIVDRYLRVKGEECIFAIGDVASFTRPKDERPLPMLAQVAVRAGQCAGENVSALVRGGKMKPFGYRIRGILLSLGRGNAAADIFGFRFYGFFAWIQWRFIYALNFPTWKRRVRAFLDILKNMTRERNCVDTDE